MIQFCTKWARKHIDFKKYKMKRYLADIFIYLYYGWLIIYVEEVGSLFMSLYAIFNINGKLMFLIINDILMVIYTTINILSSKFVI